MTTQQTKEITRKVTPIERFFSRSPFSIVTLAMRVRGKVSKKSLEIAVLKLRERHVNLRYRIKEDENNQPWFTTEGTADIPIEVYQRKEADDWIEISQKMNQVPFEFETKPAIRFLLVQSKDVSEIVIMCHHIICDGMSLAYLARDLMVFLENPDKELEILAEEAPISLENLPKDVSMNGIVKFFMKRMNDKWQQSKVVFDEEDYKTITEAYWKNYKHKLLAIELSEKETDKLVTKCRQEGVTVNSAITTAFSGASGFIDELEPFHSRTVVAADLRERLSASIGEGMGFFAGGVDMKYEYDHAKSFWDNARKFHKTILPMYTNKNLFKEALTWSYLDPSISEAMNFKKIGSIAPSESPCYEKLNSFSEREDVVSSILKRENLDSFDNIFLGTAVTNLACLDFPRVYGDLELERLIFKPGGAFPLSNINLLVGAVTCSGKLSLLLEYSDQNFDESGIEKIKSMALSLLFD